MINKSIILFALFFLNSCIIKSGGNNSLNSKVQIVAAPYGASDTVTPRRPIIFIGQGNYTCRPNPVSIKDIYTNLSRYDLGEGGFAKLFSITEDDVLEINRISSSSRRFFRPVKVEVGSNVSGATEGWLKIGLLIANANEGAYLVIDSIVFTAVARHQGEVYQASDSIHPGYCSGEGQVSLSGAADGGEGEESNPLASLASDLPFLYMIPPNSQIEYRPTSTNPFHNLTLYLQGFPIINRAEELTLAQQNRVQSSPLFNNNRGSSQTQNSSSNSNSQGGGQISRSSNSIIEIPDYDVSLTLTGYFITGEGEPISSFAKRTRFTTQSSFKY